MGSIGSSMSPSARMTAASGIARQRATWPSCARSPSTSWGGTEHPGSACGRVASRPPGTMITCSLFWLADFMRRPWDDQMGGKALSSRAFRFTAERKLYLVLGNGAAIRYAVAVGADNPALPDVIPGGAPNNPMGVAAMTLSGSEYAIHGTNRPEPIGKFASYGCIRMLNDGGF